MIQKKKKKIEEITNTISKLQNPCNFNYLSKTLAAYLLRHTGFIFFFFFFFCIIQLLLFIFYILSLGVPQMVPDIFSVPSTKKG